MAFVTGRRLAALAAVSVMALTAGACAATVNQRGYLPDETKFSSIQPGIDTKSSLQERLGSPSSKGTFDEDVWYYVSSTQEDFLFFRPEETGRDIVAVSFGGDGTVAQVERYGIEDGMVVAFNDRETPAKGRELTILQQLFGNIGRGAPPISDREDPRERR